MHAGAFSSRPLAVDGRASVRGFCTLTLGFKLTAAYAGGSHWLSNLLRVSVTSLTGALKAQSICTLLVGDHSHYLQFEHTIVADIG